MIKINLSSIAASIFLVFSCANSWAEESTALPEVNIPTEVQAAVNKIYPNSKVLLSTPCKLGEDKKSSYGLLIQANEDASKNPLHALIVINNKKNWSVNEVPKKFDFSYGFANDFLADFWRDNSLDGSPKIRCTSPKTDEQINVEANGEFMQSYFSKLKPAIKHLCFSADSIYNSWVCESIKSDSPTPELSFVQMNAD